MEKETKTLAELLEALPTMPNHVKMYHSKRMDNGGNRLVKNVRNDAINPFKINGWVVAPNAREVAKPTVGTAPAGVERGAGMDEVTKAAAAKAAAEAEAKKTIEMMEKAKAEATEAVAKAKEEAEAEKQKIADGIKAAREQANAEIAKIKAETAKAKADAAKKAKAAKETTKTDVKASK